MGAWACVLLLICVAVAALAPVFVGVFRSIHAYGFYNGRLLSRPAAPWTLAGLVLVLVDGIALGAWLHDMPG